MKPPSSVKVGPLVWKILYKRGLKDAVGETHLRRQVICIEKGVPDSSIKVTLLHEIFHAIAWTYGFHPDKKDLEESVVSLFSAAILGVFQDNPEVLAYLTSP